MVEFHPFRGYLPNLDRGENVCGRISPPYDVIDDQERATLQSRPHNVTKITLGGEGGDYRNASDELRKWISTGRITKDETESFYLYRQTFEYNGRRLTRTGLVGLLAVQDYKEGWIIPHEETNPWVKEDRLNLLRATNAHLESIFGLYDELDEDLEKEMQRSSVRLYECAEPSGTIHVFSRISNEKTVERIRKFLESKKILIADGHHRYETALRYSLEKPEDEGRRWILTTLVSSKDPGMLVFPTHRLISSINFSEEEFVNELERLFALEAVDGPRRLKDVVDKATSPTLGIVFKSGRALKASPRKLAEGMLGDVDAYVFQKYILDDALSSSFEKDWVKIEYDHDSCSVLDKMKSGAYDLAVLLRPPSLAKIWEVARAGEKMPKKTTYFWPKIWSGFVFHLLRD